MLIELSEVEYHELIHALAFATAVTVRQPEHREFKAVVLRSVNVIHRDLPGYMPYEVERVAGAVAGREVEVNPATEDARIAEAKAAMPMQARAAE